MRTLSAMVVAAALLLVGAAPASAVTGGFGVAKSLRGLPLPVSVSKVAGDKKHTFCEATGGRTSKTVQKSKFLTQVQKQFVPVACEQPPRSQLNTADALKQATAAAFAVLG